MRITWRGGEYPMVDPTDMTRPELSEIRKLTGLMLRDVLTGLNKMDGDTLAAYLYVLRKRAGETVKWSDFDTFSVTEVDFLRDADDPEPAESTGDDTGDDELDPT